MTAQACVAGKTKSPAACSAGAAPALSLAQKDNCNNRRSQFVAEQNIGWYIRFSGEDRVMVGYLTCPGAQSLIEFQRKWHSFLTGVLSKVFVSGMWVRERQSRTGEWHAHFVVVVGFDVRSRYPWEEVARRDYRNVDQTIRDLWKVLREGSKTYGFGRSNLEPIKTSGEAAARYVSKYLSKRTGSTKMVGEEKARLFGLWGTRRYCSSQFSWNTSGGRESRVKKKLIAQCLALISRSNINGHDDFRRVLGRKWWNRIRPLIVTEKKWPKQMNRTPGWVFDRLWQLYNPSPDGDAPYWS